MQPNNLETIGIICFGVVVVISIFLIYYIAIKKKYELQLKTTESENLKNKFNAQNDCNKNKVGEDGTSVLQAFSSMYANQQEKAPRSVKDIISEAVAQISLPVISTMGPHGKLVMYGKSALETGPTKDGVTVARNIWSDDKATDMVIDTIRQIAIETVDLVGDGTTTSINLAFYLYSAIDQLQRAGETLDTKQLSQQLDKLLLEFEKEVGSISKEIENMDELSKIAYSASNQDPVIAENVTRLVYESKESDRVEVEKTDNKETRIQEIKGMLLDCKQDQDMVEDHETILYNPFISIIDEKIESWGMHIPTQIQAISKLNENEEVPRALLIIARFVNRRAIAALKELANNNDIRVYVTSTPSFDRMKDFYCTDLATLTGCSYYSESTGKSFLLEKEPKNLIGSAAKIYLYPDEMIVVPYTRFVEERKPDIIAGIKRSLEASVNDKHLTWMHKKRLSFIDGVYKTIYVGGITPAEIDESADRYEDAIKACEAAKEEGIVPGAGSTFMRLLQDKYELPHELNQAIAISVIDRLLINSKYDADRRKKVKETIIKKSGEWTYDLITEEMYGPSSEMFVWTSAKTVRIALKNAISIVKILMNTETILVPQQQYQTFGR